jgi:hypothetical protein
LEKGQHLKFIFLWFNKEIRGFNEVKLFDGDDARIEARSSDRRKLEHLTSTDEPRYELRQL